MNDEYIRSMVGRQTAVECLVFALARTHPAPDVLSKDFLEVSEIMKTHLLNLPLSEEYLTAFDAAMKQILSKAIVSK